MPKVAPGRDSFTRQMMTDISGGEEAPPAASCHDLRAYCVVSNHLSDAPRQGYIIKAQGDKNDLSYSQQLLLLLFNITTGPMFVDLSRSG